MDSTSLPTLLPSGPGAFSLPAGAPAADLPRRRGRLLPAVLFGLSLLTAAAFIGLNGYAAWLLAHPPIAAVGSNPMLARGLDYADVSFPSGDGRTTVDGWWIPAASPTRTVVLSHGYGANREELWVPMYDIAAMLHQMGYNVLMFDYGYASPEHRTPATGGRIEAEQLIGALRFARERGTEKLIVWGFSMGAGTALQAALRLPPGAIDGMILDSTFLPTEDTLFRNIQRYAPVPKALTLSLIRLFLPLWSGTQLDRIPAEQAETTPYPFPILLIHGASDDKAPVAIAEKVAAAQRNPGSKLWIVPDGVHEMLFRTHPDEYRAVTGAFLERIGRAPDVGRPGDGARPA
jgi:pimeloyl-ACP methyl ester carboxylesterase